MWLSNKRDLIQAVILFLFICPLFFQLQGSIFTDDGIFNSRGRLLQLPLPIASISCFLGIALFLKWGRRHFSLFIILAMSLVLMLSAIVSTVLNENFVLSRFVLVIQFLLPVFGLLLGSLYEPPKSKYLKFEAIMLYVLLLVIPLEVVATMVQGNVHLASNIYLFSLYQHLQYLPVIFVSFILIAASAFADEKQLRYLVFFLAAWIGVYLATALSINAILIMVIGMIVLVLSLNKMSKRRYSLIFVGIVLVSFSSYFLETDQSRYYSQKLGVELRIAESKMEIFRNLEEKHLSEHQNSIVAALPSNLRERVLYWLYFGEGILESPQTLLFGHTSRPDRDIFPSAHNYYLDIIYNFGVFSILPFLYLCSITLRDSWRFTRRSSIDPNLIMLMILVSFFVFIDSSLKVGLRQPYPGMMMFFIWGVLLKRLSFPLDAARANGTESDIDSKTVLRRDAV